ncbi:hypothetical protein [Flavobacterium sp.]|uniref:hypothetical protein n=1 Tax=Flavobacterium sp. TaxID=239 RepID=UPI0025F1990A|nr:hypothetical protein [Flavobacterium sp.]
MKNYVIILILLVSLSAFSQSVNEYQYVVVPIKFDIFKEKDRFRLNTLTKLLLQKYSFKAYLNTEILPDEVRNNRCAILYASLVEDKGFFITKVKVVLKDCQDKVVFETDFGSSREKEYAVAYNQTLRAAFQSFDKLKYKYNGLHSLEKNTTTSNATASVVVPSALKLDVGECYAQPIANGFQLVDSETKVILFLYKTSQENIFIATKGSINGVLFSKNEQWFFEYYENEKLISEMFSVKF